MVSSGGVLMVAAALAAVAATWLWAALARLVWRPYAVARAFARQARPAYRLYFGNTRESKAMLRAATSSHTLDRELPRHHPARHAAAPRLHVALRDWFSRIRMPHGEFVGPTSIPSKISSLSLELSRTSVQPYPFPHGLTDTARSQLIHHSSACLGRLHLCGPLVLDSVRSPHLWFGLNAGSCFYFARAADLLFCASIEHAGSPISYPRRAACEDMGCFSVRPCLNNLLAKGQPDNDMRDAGRGGWWLTGVPVVVRPTPALCVGSYDMVKRILSDKVELYPKPSPPPGLLALMGMGLVFTQGDDWVRHRRVLKMMTGAMVACAGEVIREWESRAAANGGEVTVEVGKQFAELTADVISHTAFGSSYRQGKEVFLAQRELQFIAFTSFATTRFPGAQYVPTKSNLRRWRLESKVRDTLVAIIDDRMATAKKEEAYGHDLLGLMLEANACGGEDGKSAMSMDEIIDECKTFFFAGQDTTSHLLGLFGGSTASGRKSSECGTGAITGDVLNKLKLVTMVEPCCGVKVLLIPIAMLHRDEEIWGADAGEFNPLRFRNGVGRAAAHPSALLAFAAGPRSCIGQDFAMLEVKATLALILRWFAFDVAPEYVHAPTDIVTLQPLQGLLIVLKLLDP
ncbi:hypothetical protein HU200_067840 [Digitaria exilis]|uniref:Cytochrome P450 n=1 Tax=Digitaria exilis TaxID=1010633 RepID=A0A835DVK6_9POAL|nr:hypothetical protein HU200_067840 [Digitaria exilis]